MNFYELTPLNIKEYLFNLEFVQSIDNYESLSLAHLSNGLNLVYLLNFENKSKTKLILKQTLSHYRNKKDKPLSQYRFHSEIKAYKIAANNTPDLIPKIYFSSESMKVIIMEYIENATSLADGLLQKNLYPNLAQDMAIYLSHNFFRTSSFFLQSTEKREIISFFNKNSDACFVTEKYIFTERIHTKKISKINKSDLYNELSHNEIELESRILELKYKFMTQTDALVHGDLRPGSILVNQDKTIIIDPEFSFVGPSGYDLGSFFYIIIAAIVSFSLSKGNEEYVNWLFKVLHETYDSFEKELLHIWKKDIESGVISSEHIDDKVFHTYQKKILTKNLQDSVGFCAVQIKAMMIPFLTTNSNDLGKYIQKENNYYYTMDQISHIFLEQYKKIQNFDTIIKILKTLTRN